MSKGREKRGRCDVCPATKRVMDVKVYGQRMRLCEMCRLSLSKIIRERESEKKNTDYRSPLPGLDDPRAIAMRGAFEKGIAAAKANV